MTRKKGVNMEKKKPFMLVIFPIMHLGPSINGVKAYAWLVLKL